MKQNNNIKLIFGLWLYLLPLSAQTHLVIEKIDGSERSQEIDRIGSITFTQSDMSIDGIKIIWVQIF